MRAEFQGESLFDLANDIASEQATVSSSFNEDPVPDWMKDAKIHVNTVKTLDDIVPKSKDLNTSLKRVHTFFKRFKDVIDGEKPRSHLEGFVNVAIISGDQKENKFGPDSFAVLCDPAALTEGSSVPLAFYLVTFSIKFTSLKRHDSREHFKGLLTTDPLLMFADNRDKFTPAGYTQLLLEVFHGKQNSSEAVSS